MSRILSEVETFPYVNEIEALDFATPTILAKDNMVLYIISLPKVQPESYNHILARTSVGSNSQVDISFDEMLVNQRDTFGIKYGCLLIRHSTVCKATSLAKIPEDSCVVRIIKGSKTNVQEIVELVGGDTIFFNKFQRNGQLCELLKALRRYIRCTI